MGYRNLRDFKALRDPKILKVFRVMLHELSLFASGFILFFRA